MPNMFAYVVLYSWPLIAIFLFRVMPVPKAIAWTVVAGYLFLPEQTGFDLPLLPAVDKTFIPAVSALVMTLAIWSFAKHGSGPAALTAGGKWIFWALLGLLLFSPFITVMTNAEPVIAGELHIPGLRLYDAFAIINSALVQLLPFLLARRFLATEEDHVTLLKVLALGGALYILPILVEVRLSPQLNVWIYGFFGHSFLQHVRGDGFRPIVFLYHGLMVAIFIGCAVLAAAAVWRCRSPDNPRVGWLLLTAVLVVVLLLVKSLGAVVIAFVILPIILFSKLRTQMRLAAMIAVITITYPLLRGADLVPVSQVAELAYRIDPDRSSSLIFRIENEDQLLERASLKPLAGWGIWGRQEIYDSETGRLMSTIDGVWVGVIGARGWLGYFGIFGLLTFPIILLWRRQNALKVGPASAGLCLVLCANLIDLLPNSSLTPVTWLIAGALMGRLGTIGSADSGLRKAS